MLCVLPLTDRLTDILKCFMGTLNRLKKKKRRKKIKLLSKLPFYIKIKKLASVMTSICRTLVS